MSEDGSAGRVALVTGGGTGIGAAAAALLRKDGWDVVICGRRREPLERVAGQTGAVPVVADLADLPRCPALVEQVVDRFGRLDGLVLNAGIQALGTLESQTAQEWDAILATNVTAPFHLAKAALPHLLAVRGAIVSVASVAALRSPNAMAAYAPSKAALLSLTQQIAVDYGPRGLRANVVCPGWTRTELADAEMTHFGAGRGMDVDTSYGWVTSFVPMRRPALAEEAGAAIAYLLSPAASYVNAAVLTVDGGHTALDPGTVPFDPRVSIADPL
jgi:NAD(P)-dependent dehydrogenase (short-subunit alcohol dehydrogenase family)